MRLLPKIRVENFNRGCALFAFLWLMITVPLGIIHRPTIPDFGQFYMGGLLASRGEWSAIYPTPVIWSLDNPGLSIHSIAKPTWKLLAAEKGVPDWTHFILPPPSALIFTPLAKLNYDRAFWLWTAVLTVSSYILALCSARTLRYIFRGETRLEGLLILLVALSPTTARAIRVSNVSPVLAMLLGLSILGLIHGGRNVKIALALVSGAILKYATLVLAPILVAMGRWRILAWLCAFGLLSVAVTYWVSGLAPFREFQQMIMPTLDRPSVFRGNQSLPGFLARIFGRPLPESVQAGLSAARLVWLGTILGLFAAVPKRRWKEPILILSGSGVLLGWLMMFSPIAWEHWPIFLCPLWGWLLWEMREPGWQRWVAGVSLLLMYFPAGIIQVPGFAVYDLLLPEPWNSWQLIGIFAFTAFSLLRFARAVSSEPAATKEVVQEGQLDLNPEGK